jgi:Cu(I)/Ag(I) efflux system membrane fusion protein
MEPAPGATPTRVPIDVTAVTLKQLGIRVEEVRRESLTEAVRAVATVVPDESRISQVHTRVSGWIEQLDVNTTGRWFGGTAPRTHLLAGTPRIPDRVPGRRRRRQPRASRARGRKWAHAAHRPRDDPADIDEIERTGEPKRLVIVVAPRSGVVMERGVTVGTSVDPSTTLLTIADLSSVWILAEVPEVSIQAVRVGMQAQLDFPASGRPPFPAVLPSYIRRSQRRTRTLRVRISRTNPTAPSDQDSTALSPSKRPDLRHDSAA